MKMSFHSQANKTHFDMKGCAPGLALKKRHRTTRKWPGGKHPLSVYFPARDQGPRVSTLLFLPVADQQRRMLNERYSQDRS